MNLLEQRQQVRHLFWWPTSGSGAACRSTATKSRLALFRCGGRTPATPTHPAPARQRMQGSAIMAVCDACKQATITHRICAERAGGTGCCRCAGGGRCAAVRAACGLGTVGGGVNDNKTCAQQTLCSSNGGATLPALPRRFHCASSPS